MRRHWKYTRNYGFEERFFIHAERALKKVQLEKMTKNKA